jgi:hypothetical protein
VGMFSEQLRLETEVVFDPTLAGRGGKRLWSSKRTNKQRDNAIVASLSQRELERSK